MECLGGYSEKLVEINRIAMYLGDGRLRSLFKFWFKHRVLGIGLDVKDVRELFSTPRDYWIFRYYGLTARKLYIVGRSYLLFTNSEFKAYRYRDLFEVIEGLEKLVETYSRLYELIYTPSFVDEELNLVQFYDLGDYDVPFHEDIGLLVGVNDDGKLFSNIVAIDEYVDHVREVVYSDKLITIYGAKPRYPFIGVRRPANTMRSVNKWYRVQGDLLIRLNNTYRDVDEVLERIVRESTDLDLTFEIMVEDIVERLYARLGFSVEVEFNGSSLQIETRLIDDRGLRASVLKRVLSKADKMVIEGLNDVLNRMFDLNQVIRYRRTHRKLSRAGSSNRILSLTETFVTRTYEVRYLLNGVEVYRELFKKRIAESLRNRAELLDTVIVHGNHRIYARALSLAGVLDLSSSRTYYVRTDHGVYEIGLRLEGDHRTYIIVNNELEIEHPEHGSKIIRFDQRYKGLLKEISIGNTPVHRNLNNAFINTSLIKSIAERRDPSI